MDNFNYQAYIKSGKIHGKSESLTEAQATGFGIGQGRSKTISKGKESNPDLKDTLKDEEPKKSKYFMKNGIPHKADGTPLKRMNNEEENVEEGYGDRADASGSGLENIVNGLKKLTKASGPAAKKAYAALQALGAGAGAAMRNEEKADLQKEDARTDAEQEGYKDGFEDAKDDIEDALKKMKVSELKAKIKEQILSELTLDEAEEDDREDDELSPEELANKYAGSPMREADEEVDVDIDVEDEVEVDAEADDIEIERPGVKTTVDVGLSPEEEIVQDSLKAAMDAAQALGSEKLADQIGNTITFFTRQFVVGNSTD